VTDKIEPLRLTYSVEQAARALGISRAFAYESVANGDIPSVRIGRRIVVPVDALRAMLETSVSRNPRTVPQDVKIAVALRDGGRCRQCSSVKDLHFDHVIPWSKGGASTVANIQLLCGSCNRAKRDSGG
jgi:excisionase family DNA binding protein